MAQKNFAAQDLGFGNMLEGGASSVISKAGIEGIVRDRLVTIIAAQLNLTHGAADPFCTTLNPAHCVKAETFGTHRFNRGIATRHSNHVIEGEFSNSHI